MEIPGRHRHSIDLLADANALLSGFALYPQLFRAFTEPSSRPGLAPATFFMIFAAQIIWFLYGLHRRSTPIIITSILSAIASGCLLFFSLASR